MRFDLYSEVILTTDMSEDGLKAGGIGTVVEGHVAPAIEDGYSVEFFDMTGNTVAVVTVQANALRTPTQGDRPAARTMTAGA